MANCEPTYEELKHAILGEPSVNLLYCEPTYEELKQNLSASSAIKSWYDCEPTYEELKLELLLCKPLGFSFIASLPMRNWNTFLQESLESEGFLLRAYLWGIETLLQNQLPLLLYDCEPTYEELKLCFTFSFSNQSNYCEPTYEELKQPYRYYSWYFKIYCEPTYEELKLKLRKPCGICLYIASLPMRNWNRILQNCSFVILCIASLLWGIETSGVSTV